VPQDRIKYLTTPLLEPMAVYGVFGTGGSTAPRRPVINGVAIPGIALEGCANC
jgi:hypothetical protein